MTFSLAMLRNARTREQLALCWRYFRLCEDLIPEHDWSEAKTAFQNRAQELGLTWKQ